MADIRPFPAIRPEKEDAIGTACLSYEEVLERYRSGRLFRQHFPEYYIYEVKEGDRVRTGIFACASIDDYLNGVIRNHGEVKYEVTEEQLSQLETNRVQTVPVVLAYHKQPNIETICKAKKCFAPDYHFVTPDEVEHTIWALNDYSKVFLVIQAMVGTKEFFIESGNEVAAAAAAHCQDMRKADRDYDPSADFNYFMCILLPYEDIVEDGVVSIPKFQTNMFSYAI